MFSYERLTTFTTVVLSRVVTYISCQFPASAQPAVATKGGDSLNNYFWIIRLRRSCALYEICNDK